MEIRKTKFYDSNESPKCVSKLDLKCWRKLSKIFLKANDKLLTGSKEWSTVFILTVYGYH